MYISCIGEGSYLYLATHSNKPRVLSVVASDPSGIELNTTQPQKRIIIRKKRERRKKKERRSTKLDVIIGWLKNTWKATVQPTKKYRLT